MWIVKGWWFVFFLVYSDLSLDLSTLLSGDDGDGDDNDDDKMNIVTSLAKVLWKGHE